MKRFAFWFVLGLVALSVIKANRESIRSHQDNDHQRNSSMIVVYKTDGPKLDKRGTVLYKVAGEDRRESTLKQIAKRYRDSKIVEVENIDDRDEGDDHENKGDRVASRRKERIQGLLTVIQGAHAAEANIEHLPPDAPQAPIAPVPPIPPVEPVAADIHIPSEADIHIPSEADIHIPSEADIHLPSEADIHIPSEPEQVATVVDEFGELKDVKVKPVTSLAGRISATKERAKADARVQLVGLIRSRLEGEVPREWPIPEELVDAMIQKTDIKTSQRDFGTYYEAILTLDPNPDGFQTITAAHRHEQVVKRLTLLGGGLGFVLICLGALSGYIKADEATKGYYTNPLRLASAAGVGAGGVLLYQMFINKI